MKIAYICGSPRKAMESNSALILRDLEAFFKERGAGEGSSVFIRIPRSLPEEGVPFREEAEDADVWLISFPLYVDSLPGHLCRWLKRYEEYREDLKSRGARPPSPRVYGISNCGFPEALQNREALMVLETFCRKNGLDWRFGIGIGMGEPYRQMHSMPLKAPAKREIRAAFQALADDLDRDGRGSGENLYGAVRFPVFLYRLMGSLGWRGQARKYGVKHKELFGRPLLDE